MIIEAVCVDSEDFLKALTEEYYNKKHNRYSYFNNTEQLTNAILKDCPNYGKWWLKNKQNSYGVWYCYLKTNGRNVDPAFERITDWKNKTIKLDQAVITSGRNRLKNIKRKIEISELNMDKDPEYSIAKAKSFYHSEEWQRLRYKALQEANGKCCLCGRSVKENNVILNVDHVIPLSVCWNLRNKIENLQVLCKDCNLGKQNKDITFWK